jgi:hypothetical protein
MHKERVLPLSVKKLGKLDEIVLENGKNSKDGWGYSAKVDDERSPFPHAWVEYLGVPISDPLDVRYGYVEIQRYGDQRKNEHDV